MKVKTAEPIVEPGWFKKLMFGQNAYKNVESFVAEEPKAKTKAGVSVLKKPSEMSYLEYVDEVRKLEAHIEPLLKGTDTGDRKPLFCTPNCQHDHHRDQDDFTKNHKDPLEERPGLCFLNGLDNAPKS